MLALSIFKDDNYSFVTHQLWILSLTESLVATRLYLGTRISGI